MHPSPARSGSHVGRARAWAQALGEVKLRLCVGMLGKGRGRRREKRGRQNQRRLGKAGCTGFWIGLLPDTWKTLPHKAGRGLFYWMQSRGEVELCGAGGGRLSDPGDVEAETREGDGGSGQSQSVKLGANPPPILSGWGGVWGSWWPCDGQEGIHGPAVLTCSPRGALPPLVARSVRSRTSRTGEPPGCHLPGSWDPSVWADGGSRQEGRTQPLRVLGESCPQKACWGINPSHYEYDRIWKQNLCRCGQVRMGSSGPEPT